MRKIERDIASKTQKEVKRIIEDLEDDALNCLTDFGSAHCKADQENNVNYDSLRHAESVRNRQKAQRLGKEALAELHVQRQETEKQKTRAIKARKQALDVEAVRSSYIISLPPVTFIQDAQPKEEPAKVILFDKSTLFQTEYVMKDKIVEEVSHPKVCIPSMIHLNMLIFIQSNSSNRMLERQLPAQNGKTNKGL